MNRVPMASLSSKSTFSGKHPEVSLTTPSMLSSRSASTPSNSKEILIAPRLHSPLVLDPSAPLTGAMTPGVMGNGQVIGEVGHILVPPQFAQTAW